MGAAGGSLELPVALRRVARLLVPGDRVWLVGGAVRDLLLGRPRGDLDLAAAGDALGLARRLASALDGSFVPLDAERGVARIVLAGGAEIDLAALRAPSLEEDLAARDYTVNALALTLSEPPRLVDPTGGARDLGQGVLRLIGPQALADDPLRGLRGVRFAAELGFELEAQSRAWITERAGELATVAGERVRDELFRCLAAPEVARWMALAWELGLLPAIVPELVPADAAPPAATFARLAALDALRAAIAHGAPQGRTDLAQATESWSSFRPALAAHLTATLADERPRHGLLMLAGLLAETRVFTGPDERQAAVPTRLEALRFARHEVRWVTAVLGQAPAVGALADQVPLTDRHLHRFFRRAGESGLGAALLALAASPAHGSEAASLAACVRELLAAWFLRHAEVVAPPRLLTGEEVAAALGVDPGPQVGAALAALAEAQAAGEVESRAEAVAFVKGVGTGG